MRRASSRASPRSPTSCAVARAALTLDASDEIVADGRVAFRATATFPDGRQVVEHVQLTVEDGLIVRQVDVEAWDP